MALASCIFKWISTALFCVLLVVQTSILAGKYLSDYSTIDGISFVGLLVLPVLISLVLITFICENQLSKLWIVWSCYVIQMVVFVAIIFGTDVREKLDKESFWNPGTLKTTMCITPILAVLLISAASDSRQYVDLVDQLCVNIAMHLFDTIEILSITFSPEASRLPKSMIITIIVCVSLGLMLSPLALVENKLLRRGKYKVRKKVYLSRLILEMLVVNMALLVVRLIAWLAFKEEASIFITKNAIIIGVSIVEILKCSDCFAEEYNDCKYRRCPCDSEDDGDH